MGVVLLLALPALPEAIALTIHFQDVNVMGQSVEKCAGDSVEGRPLRSKTGAASRKS